ncbi:MAG: sulfurtransferase [Acidimicrobiales bacterium]
MSENSERAAVGPLVSVGWLAEHLDDPQVRIIDVHLDPVPYEEGHIRGAVAWPAIGSLIDADYRHDFDAEHVTELLERTGIDRDTIVVATSDHLALAPWAYWYLKSVGYDRVVVLDGGPSKWLAEGHPLTAVVPEVAPTTYQAPAFDSTRQARLADVRAAVDDEAAVLLDVRTPEEWDGEIFMQTPAVADERAGHIPGAVHLFYGQAHQPDGTFCPTAELAALYADHGVRPDQAVITYCAVGMRSAHTWFVLSEMLRYPDVRSYDRSWNEWGRLPDTPIETSESAS